MKILYYSKSIFPFNGFIATLMRNGAIKQRRFCHNFLELMEYAHINNVDEVFSKDNMTTKEQLTMLLSDINAIGIDEADDIIDEVQAEITEYYWGNSQYKDEKEIITEFFGEYHIEYLAPFIVK